MSAPFRHIACCMDESESALRALEEARRLRGFGEGRLTLLHVVQYPPPFATGYGAQINPADLMSAAERWMGEVSAGVPEGNAVVLQGYPATEACEWAAANAVDLMVVASHRNLPQRIVLGSFAHYLVNHAPCPVLVLRSAPSP
jgi:nucleotide-binding universal stress UspA family protein